MISLYKLYGPDHIIPYCGDCRMSIMSGDTYCDCGKYNKELQDLYSRDKKAYKECFVEWRGS